MQRIKNSIIMRSLFWFVMINICATIIGYFFNYIGFPETNIVIIYILAVMLIARFTDGYYWGILASIISTFSFNYFFTVPYFTFSVNDPNYIITFVIMTITSVITSALTSKIKQNIKESITREAETMALYRLTNSLTDASNIKEIASVATTIISDIFKCYAACICVDNQGELEPHCLKQISETKQVYVPIEDIAILKNELKDWKSDCKVRKEYCDWPIYSNDMLLGIIRIPKDKARNLSVTKTRLLYTMLESTALAMDRYRELQNGLFANEQMMQERYRSNLLRSISHDLRTPLSVIIGTSDMLMDMTREDPEKFELAQDIYKDADWLRTLMENILNLTRLQDGGIRITKEIEAIEEVVGSAVRHILKHYPEFHIDVIIPNELILIPMDAKLIEQVIINLLDNAIKHSNLNKNVTIKVEEELDYILFSIIDNGEGILAVDLPHIFEIFYTAKNNGSDSKTGMGIGLSICQTIVEAHGGKIFAFNRTENSGAIMKFSLPRNKAML